MPHSDCDLRLVRELVPTDLFHQELDLKLRDCPPISRKFVDEVDDFIRLFSWIGSRIPHWSYGLW